MSEPRLAECVPMGGALICKRPSGIYRRRVQPCWTCGRRTPFVQCWGGVYYGTTDYCTVCLDAWQDGDRLERPFERGWKKDRAARIRVMWDEAMLPERWYVWIHWDAHRAICRKVSCAECETRPR